MAHWHEWGETQGNTLLLGGAPNLICTLLQLQGQNVRCHIIDLNIKGKFHWCQNWVSSKKDMVTMNFWLNKFWINKFWMDFLTVRTGKSAVAWMWKNRQLSDLFSLFWGSFATTSIAVCCLHVVMETDALLLGILVIVVQLLPCEVDEVILSFAYVSLCVALKPFQNSNSLWSFSVFEKWVVVRLACNYRGSKQFLLRKRSLFFRNNAEEWKKKLFAESPCLTFWGPLLYLWMLRGRECLFACAGPHLTAISFYISILFQW